MPLPIMLYPDLLLHGTVIRALPTSIPGAISNGGWTKGLFANNAIVSSIRVFPRSSRSMVGGEFFGVDSSGTETSLVQVTSQPPLEWTTFSVSGSNSYSAVVYKGPNGSYCSIAEIEVYGSAKTAPTNAPSNALTNAPTNAPTTCSITYKDGEPSAELRPCCQAYYDEFRADHTEWAYFNNHDVSALGEGDLINPHYFGARYRNFWRGALVTITFLEVSQILALHQFTVNAAE